MVGGSGVAIKNERPVTPMPTAAPLSKRDRRRTALAEKLLDLTSAFAQSRDVHYRQQLQILQADMGLILNADPYHDHPLDDHGQDIVGMVENILGVGGYTALPATNVTGGHVGHSRSDLDSSAMKGKSYAKFVEKVNDLMEERDAQLTVAAVRLPIHPPYLSTLRIAGQPISSGRSPRLMRCITGELRTWATGVEDAHSLSDTHGGRGAPHLVEYLTTTAHSDHWA